MSSCATPIIGSDGKTIGVITIDIELTAIQNIVNSIQIGEKGKAVLLNSAGLYLSSKDESKIMNLNIKDEENKSLANIGNTILQQEKGDGTYVNGNETYNVYFNTLEKYGWKLAIEMPQSELYAATIKMTTNSTIIGVLAVIICIVLVTLQITSVANGIIKINNSVALLAAGDFTKEPDI